MSKKIYFNFSSRVEGLSFPGKLLFSCSCCQLTVPIFTYFDGSISLQEILDLVWGHAEGTKLSLEQVEELKMRASSLVPMLDDEAPYDLEKDILMKSSVTVLEALDVLTGSYDSTLNAACLCLDLALLIDVGLGRADGFNFDIFDAIEKGVALPLALEKTWASVNGILEAVQYSSDIVSIKSVSTSLGIELGKSFWADLRERPKGGQH